MAVIPDQDFINKYSARLQDQFMLPEMWAKKLSCTLASSVIGKNAFMKTMYGRNRLNIWNSVFAPSGTGKSVVWDNDCIPILAYVGAKLEQNYILPSIKSSFEGITDRARESGLSGCIFRDEMSTLFQESRGGYTASVLETYSKLYDGWIYPRSTRQVQVAAPIPVFVSLIGASTPKYIYDVMPVKMFYQGAGNRIDYELWRPEYKEDATTEDLFGEFLTPEELAGRYKKNIDVEQEQFAKMLIKMADYHNNKDFVLCSLESDAADLSREFYNKQRKHHTSIPEEGRFSFKKEYIVRQWQKSLKYAGLIELCKPRLLPRQENSETVFISAESIQEGIDIVLHNYDQFEKIVTEWIGHQKTETQKLKDDLGIALRYLQLVKSYNLISQKRLAMEVGNTGRNKEFYNITTFLVETGCIKVSTQAQSRKILMNCEQEWADNMLVSKKPRSTPSTFYRFSKDLSTTQKEKLEGTK